MRTIKSAFTHKMRVEREGIEERKKNYTNAGSFATSSF